MARTLQPELMDSASAADVALNLRDLSRINRWFGGNRALAKVLDPYLRRNPEALVLDVGAANGETLRWLSARYPLARFVALDQAATAFCSSRLVFHSTYTPKASTEQIGAIEAAAKMPKPSKAPTALPKPKPMASTNGTVTGPVVTPALSQPTFTKASEDKAVKINAMM